MITENKKLNIINNNNPLTPNTIDKIGIKLIKDCFNNTKVQNKSINIKKFLKNIIINNDTEIQNKSINNIKSSKNTKINNNIKNKKNNIFDNNIMNSQNINNIMNSQNINNSLNKIIKKTFMFDFKNQSYLELLKAFLIITILILLGIKVFDR